MAPSLAATATAVIVVGRQPAGLPFITRAVERPPTRPTRQPDAPKCTLCRHSCAREARGISLHFDSLYIMFLPVRESVLHDAPVNPRRFRLRPVILTRSTRQPLAVLPFLALLLCRKVLGSDRGLFPSDGLFHYYNIVVSSTTSPEHKYYRPLPMATSSTST